MAASTRLTKLLKAVLLLATEPHGETSATASERAVVEAKRAAVEAATVELDRSVQRLTEWCLGALDVPCQGDIEELKALQRPPRGIGEVLEATMCLLRKPPLQRTFAHAKRMMAAPAAFLSSLS